VEEREEGGRGKRGGREMMGGGAKFPPVHNPSESVLCAVLPPECVLYVNKLSNFLDPV